MHEQGLISEKEYVQKLNEIQNGLFNQETYVQQIQQQLAKRKEVNDRLLKLTSDAAEDQQNIIQKESADEQTILNNKYTQGLISKSEYEKESANLTIKFGKEALQASIFAIPLAPTIGALGAAQLAAVIATPVPEYRKGTENHPGGLAIVGDAGKQEVIQTPDKKYYVTPNKSTLVDIPKHSKVFPDPDKFLKHALSITNPKMPLFTTTQSMENIRFEEMTKRIEKQLREIREAIKNKKEFHYEVDALGVRTKIRDAHNEWGYLNENFQF